MAGQGVVNIGLNVDYQKSLNAMIQEFRTSLTKISSEFKKTELTANLEAQIAEFAKTTQAHFDKINNGKLDAKSFEEFQVKVNSQFEKIGNKISNLRQELNNLDSGQAVKKLTRQFDELKEHIASSYEPLKEIITLVNGNGFGGKTNQILDKTALNEYRSTITEIRKAQKEIFNLNFSSHSDDALFDDLTRQEALLQEQVATYKELKAEIASISPSSQGYSKLENDLVRAQMAANKTSESIQFLDSEIATRNLGAGMEDSTKGLISSINHFDDEIDNFVARANKMIKENQQLKSSVEQTQTAFNTFQVKNGAIQIPIEIATKDETLQQQLQEIITRLQGYADGRSVIAKVKLTDATTDDAANQWAVIEGKFATVAGEEGKLLAKNKEHKIAMQELATEYQKYLDMGGTNNFSDLTNHKATVKNLTKAYEELCMSVQDTTQQQEKQQSVPASTGIDSKTIQVVTQENKSLETQAGKTSTAIDNEANSAQSASEKFRKLSKEKGNATIANRELAKAAKETADALEREAKARKEAESSRGSKNAIDNDVYNANSLEWQRKIKQELLDSGNYAEVYNAKISQTAKGNVSFASSVQTMDGEWKSFTATLDNSGNIISSKLKDLTEKQVSAIERAKEQARQMMEALARAMSGEEAETVSYDRNAMEQLVADAVSATQAIEGLDAKYKATLNNDGSITITKTLTEANGIVKTFTAEFNDVKTVINAVNSSVEEFSNLLNEAFQRAKVSISTKAVGVDTSDTETVISQYNEIYETAKKLSDINIKISGLDVSKNANQLKELRAELGKLEETYSGLVADFFHNRDIELLPMGKFQELSEVFDEAAQKITEIKAKLADGFVSKGYSALDSFNKKYSDYEGYSKYSDDIKKITEEIKTLSSQEGLDSVKKKLQDIGQALSNIKTNNANEIKLGTIIEGGTFSDINELRSNIVSLMSNIGEVNEKSIKIKGAKSLSAEVKKTNGEIHNMTINLDNNGFAHYVDNGIAEFKRLGSAAESVFKGIKDLVRIYLSPQDFIRYFRQGFDAVTEVDIALTELIKVSDASNSAIAEYFDGAVESAKELGSSVTDMISATADWARLGYNLPDSKTLGKVAVLYKNVGDGIDIDTANESLVSTLQGFQLEADDAMSIIDAFNEVIVGRPLISKY